MSDQTHNDDQTSREDRTRPRFDHIFPWPEFLERATTKPFLAEIRSGVKYPTLRDIRPVFTSADEIRRLAPPGEIQISLEEELRTNVTAEIFDYIRINTDGFVEHDVVPANSISEDLLRALHFVWLDRDPSSPIPRPTVQRIAELTRKLSSKKE